MRCHPAVSKDKKYGFISKESWSIRPESFVLLSLSIQIKGASKFLAAKPGIAVKASLASPSIAAPSEIAVIQTRGICAKASAIAKPWLCGRAEPKGPLLK